MKSRWIVVLLIGAVMMSGCRAFRGKKGAGDTVDIEAWDSPLSERFEDGVRVTDVRFEPVRFAYDSYQVENSEVGKIESVAAYMRDDTGVRLVVEGHCDERGSREYNMSLGEHRALAVRAYLVGLGIDGARVQTRSYGEEQPADPGHGESAWRQNRRVEFALYR
ncbi:MAG: OmpA family protein [Lentisphaerae bacterium]|nr:OmpA family protein [Lentisphaerota bacterium]